MRDLQPVVAPYLNRPLTRGDLAKMKYDIAKRYYEDGYILVRVVTPPNQDLTRGVLNVTVYEAKIDKVTVGKDAAVRPFITGAIASEVHPGDVFNESDVESMVRDLDDLHGAKASVNLVPGSQVGTTALDVNVQKTNDFNQYVSVNNYGSKLTGEWLFNAGLQWGNLLGLGELYTLNFTHSNQDLLTVSGGIQTPIGFKNMILDTSYLYSNSTVNGDLANLGTDGHDGPVPDRAVERAAEHGQAEDHGSPWVRCGPLPVEHHRRDTELRRQDAPCDPGRQLSAAAVEHDGLCGPSAIAGRGGVRGQRRGRCAPEPCGQPGRVHRAAHIAGAPEPVDVRWAWAGLGQGPGDGPVCQRHAAGLRPVCHRRLWQRARLPAGAGYGRQRHAGVGRA